MDPYQSPPDREGAAVAISPILVSLGRSDSMTGQCLKQFLLTWWLTHMLGDLWRRSLSVVGARPHNRPCILQIAAFHIALTSCRGHDSRVPEPTPKVHSRRANTTRLPPHRRQLTEDVF